MTGSPIVHDGSEGARSRLTAPLHTSLTGSPILYKRSTSPSHTPEQWWRLLRILVPVAAAVALAAVPTLFTIFPAWTDWRVQARVVLISAWLLVAVVAGIFTAIADRRLHLLMEADQRALVRAEHRTTLNEQFRSILFPGVGGMPEHYHLTVYAPTHRGDFLVPLFPPAVGYDDPAIFRVGSGATGKAWKDSTGSYVVTGPAVSDRAQGLTAVQQRRYRMFGTVAAVVITDADGKPVGVLSAISRERARSFDERIIEIMRDLAESIAWLVPEAVKWLMPTEV